MKKVLFPIFQYKLNQLKGNIHGEFAGMTFLSGDLIICYKYWREELIEQIHNHLEFLDNRIKELIIRQMEWPSYCNGFQPVMQANIVILLCVAADKLF